MRHVKGKHCAGRVFSVPQLRPPTSPMWFTAARRTAPEPTDLNAIISPDMRYCSGKAISAFFSPFRFAFGAFLNVTLTCREGGYSIRFPRRSSATVII